MVSVGEKVSRVTPDHGSVSDARFRRFLTIAAVLQVGPDDVLLGEAENAESSSSHGRVDDDSGVCHQLCSFIKPGPERNTRCIHICLLYLGAHIRAGFVPPDVPDLRAVLQVPAVGHLVLPADIPGVLPQQADLVVGVPRVPQRVPQVLPRAGCRLHSLATSTTK